MDKELDQAAAGVAEPTNPAEQQVEAAETARQKALKRVRERNADRNFDDSDDEALYGAMNEDYEADSAELDNYRKNSEDLNNFLRDNPRGASLLSSMRRDGNPVGRLVEDYGEDIVRSLDDPEIQKSVVEAEARRLEQIAKDKEFEDQAASNLEKSQKVRQDLIDEGYDMAEVDDAIKEVIDRAVRNLMSDISREDIEGVLKLRNRETDLADAQRQGEVKGRNANIAKEMEKRRSQNDGMPALTKTAPEPVKKEEKNNGALDSVANRPSMW